MILFLMNLIILLRLYPSIIYTPFSAETEERWTEIIFNGDMSR